MVLKFRTSMSMVWPSYPSSTYVFFPLKLFQPLSHYREEWFGLCNQSDFPSRIRENLVSGFINFIPEFLGQGDLYTRWMHHSVTAVATQVCTYFLNTQPKISQCIICLKALSNARVCLFLNQVLPCLPNHVVSFCISSEFHLKL